MILCCWTIGRASNILEADYQQSTEGQIYITVISFCGAGLMMLFDLVHNNVTIESISNHWGSMHSSHTWLHIFNT